jgi:pantetheine-phosphate adenylyltransferase
MSGPKKRRITLTVLNRAAFDSHSLFDKLKVQSPAAKETGERVAAPQSRIVAIYPGSFDPITNGHLDMIERGSRLADRLIVAILENRRKTSLFSIQERVEMLTEVVKPFPNVEVGWFHGLLVDYVKERGANFILRGIRAISDYEYELQIAHMNRRLSPGVETVFLMAGEAYSFISSQLVKEVASLGGDVSGLVPPLVQQRLKRLLGGADEGSATALR